MRSFASGPKADAKDVNVDGTFPVDLNRIVPGKLEQSLARDGMAEILRKGGEQFELAWFHSHNRAVDLRFESQSIDDERPRRDDHGFAVAAAQLRPRGMQQPRSARTRQALLATGQ